MIRAVLDTNIIVSALLAKSSSPPVAIYQAFIAQRFLLVTSGLVLDEVEEVLNRDYLVKVHGWKPAQVSSRIETLASLAMVVPDVPLQQPVSRDANDDMFIAAAVQGKASYIVSGDKKHLLILGEYEGVRIVTAREFVGDVLKIAI
ncbi:MAG TPA: putative toxin-antitoxin system toxin component, PIN family [Anaerolineae bacterium]|jgi:putative PIN family toxin of toxin-antitoxin system